MHENLGTHVKWCTNKRWEHLSLKIINGSCESKISKFMLGAFDEDIFRFQISMNNAVFKEI